MNSKKKTVDLRKAYLFSTVCIILWGSVAVVVKSSLKDTPVIQLVFYLTLFASLSLFMILYFQKKLFLFKKYGKYDYLRMVLLGLLGIFIYNILYLKSFSFISATEVSILTYSWPIFLVIISGFLFKEKLRLVQGCSILLGFVGVTITLIDKNFTILNSHNAMGAILILISAFVYALFFALSKKYSYESFVFMFISYTASFLLSFILFIFTKGIVFPTTRFLVAIAYMGILPSAIGFSLFSEALKIGDVSKIANLIYLTPVASLIFISIFLKEPMEPIKLLGLTLILGGIVFNRTPKTVHN